MYFILSDANWNVNSLCLWGLFRIIFGVQEKNLVYFCRFCRCFYFICGIIWVVDRFMLLVYMYFADKESIGCWLLVLSIKYLFFHVLAQCRVATDLENLEKSGNLKETSESHGICLKSQGICDTIPKVREFCCLKFIFSQVEDPNFKNFLGKHAPRPPKWSWTHGRVLSWTGKVRESHIVWKVATMSMVLLF